jgi:CDP-diacylglycerol--glycerol-3-phosphate 3-phosphatidyltransferase
VLTGAFSRQWTVKVHKPIFMDTIDNPADRRRAIGSVTALTVARAPGVLLFIFGALLHAWQPRVWLPPVSLTILILASLTDLWDGWLARRWGVVTTFGAVADPLMDKVFYLAVFPTLTLLLAWDPAQRGHAVLMLLFTVSYLLRDQWVSFLRTLAAGQADLRANWMGKLRTAISFPIGCLLYLHIVYGLPPRGAMIGIEIFGLVINALSAYVYTRRFAPALRSALQAGPPAGPHP